MKAPQISGTVKTRFEDFIVNEVTKDGDVVVLDNRGVPDHLKGVVQSENSFKEIDAAGALAAVEAVLDSGGAGQSKLFELLGAEELGLIRDLVKDSYGSDEHDVANLILKVDDDKNHRKQVHKCLQETLPFLVTGTVVVEGGPQKAICVHFRQGGGTKRSRSSSEGEASGAGDAADVEDGHDSKRGRANDGQKTYAESSYAEKPKAMYHNKRGNQWPKDLPDYLHFTLVKQNWETHEALNKLGRWANTKSLDVAGTKDKRGVTTQRVSAYRIAAETMQRVCMKFGTSSGGSNSSKFAKFALGDFEYKPNKLRLGELSGNSFHIIIRDVQLEAQVEAGADQGKLAESKEAGTSDQEALEIEAEVKRAEKNVRELGFPNYYGMQRFGSNSEVPTHIIGASIIKRDYKEAVKLVLKPHSMDGTPPAQALRKFEKDEDCLAALFAMPSSFIAERAVLTKMSKEGINAAQNAIMCIPYNLRTMYGHAFQSFVFNRVLSCRLALGAKTMVGDVVLVSDESIVGQPSAGASDAETDKSMEASSSDGRAGEDAVDDIDAVSFPNVSLIETDEQASATPFTRVVLPIPGHLVSLYPKHEAFGLDVYKRIASELGVPWEYIVEPAKTSSFDLRGDYRHVTVVPSTLETEVLRYASNKDTLVTHSLSRQEHKDEVASVRAKGGPLVAIDLKFTLPPSTYATMLIRNFVRERKHIATTSSKPSKPIAEQPDPKKKKDPAPIIMPFGGVKTADSLDMST